MVPEGHRHRLDPRRVPPAGSPTCATSSRSRPCLSHLEGRISGHVHPDNSLTGHNINLTPGSIANTISMDQVAARHLGPTYLNSLVLSWRDAVRSVKDLQRTLGTIDRERLDQRLESIRDVEKRLVDKERIIDRGRPQFDEPGVRLAAQAKNSFQEHSSS